MPWWACPPMPAATPADHAGDVLPVGVQRRRRCRRHTTAAGQRPAPAGKAGEAHRWRPFGRWDRHPAGVITYFDISMLLKLVVDDESYRAESERLWLESDYVVCAEIGYAEARAALGSTHRHDRLAATALQTAKDQLELLWEQLSIVVVDTALVRAAGDLAERDCLLGYDAVHPCGGHHRASHRDGERRSASGQSRTSPRSRRGRAPLAAADGP